MRSLPLLLALSLVACAGDDPSDTGADTASGTGTGTGTGMTADAYPLTTDVQVQEALMASQMPSLLFLVTSMNVGFSNGSCPTIVETATEMTASGGCTDSEGTAFVGSVTIRETVEGGRITYTQWGWTEGGATVTLNGTHGLTLDGGVVTTEPGDGLSVVATGDMAMSVEYSSFDQVMPLFAAEARAYATQAAFTLDGVAGTGTLTVEGEMVFTQECGEALATAEGSNPADAGPNLASATYALTGSQVVTVAQTECGADCMTWTGATRGSGTICDL